MSFLLLKLLKLDFTVHHNSKMFNIINYFKHMSSIKIQVELVGQLV
jgi:hypothetical protein